MNTVRPPLVAMAIVMAVGSAAFGAFATQFTGADGGNWNVSGNWSAGIPTISDEISLGGKSVIVTDTQAYKDFDTAAPGGSITIQNGGHLSTDGGFHGAWGLSSIVIQSGGTFFNDPATEGGTAQLRSSTTVQAGGTVVGFSRIRTAFSISGLWQPYNTGTSVTDIYENTTTLNAGGTIELDVFGSGSNESLNVRTTLNIDNAASSLELVPQGGYTPAVNDTFNLIDDYDGLGTINVLSDASNVSIQGYSVQWDASQWVSDGILTIIPEPTTLGLITAGGLALLKRRRR